MAASAPTPGWPQSPWEPSGKPTTSASLSEPPRPAHPAAAVAPQPVHPASQGAGDSVVLIEKGCSYSAHRDRATGCPGHLSAAGGNHDCRVGRGPGCGRWGVH